MPPGAFNGTTPEKKASVMLTAMMTYIATWIVIDQTETIAPTINTADGADGGDSRETFIRCSRIDDAHFGYSLTVCLVYDGIQASSLNHIIDRTMLRYFIQKQKKTSNLVHNILRA